MSIFVITRLTIREASRRWILWAALVLGWLFLLVYGLGFYAIQKDIENSLYSNPIAEAETYSFLLLAGMYVVNFLVLMMSVLSSVDTLSGEINSGTIHTLVSKPVRRWEVLMGKWIGFELMLTLYFLMISGGVLLITRLVAGYAPVHALRGLVFMWMNTALLLSVTFLGGAYLSTIANGVLAFGLYSVAFIGGWMEQFGVFLKNQTAVNIGIVCSLLMPAEALWRRAASEMQSTLSNTMLRFATPFSFDISPSPLFLAYSVFYIILALYLAIRRFEQRDL